MKTSLMNNNADLNMAGMKQFIVEKTYGISKTINKYYKTMHQEPYFRYVPDRALIQRLVYRVANMKDDLAEFGYQDDQVMAP